MFSVIGIAYLIFAFAYENRIKRSILLICGTYLIVGNFLPEKSYLSLIGIVAVVVPMLIGRFSKETKQPVND